MNQVIESLGLDLKMMLLSTANFLVVFFLLNKFLFSRIGKFLNERQNEIKESIKNARKVEMLLENANKKKNKIIQKASSNANNIVNEANNQAERIIIESKVKAQREVNEIKNKAKRRIKIEKEEMISELKHQTADLAIIATEKILDKELDEETDKRIIEKYLDKIGA